MSTPEPNPIRVGMITMTDLNDPNPLSGMPYHMAGSLRDLGIEIVPILTREPRPDHPSILQRIAIRARSIRIRRTPVWLRRTLDQLFPGMTRSATIKKARRLSACAQRNLEEKISRGERFDALFGCCISTAIYGIETRIPIVYFSDATSPVLQKTYPILARRGVSYRTTLHDIEQVALRRTTLAAFAAPATQRSAINDFGIPEKQTRVIAMGAHVYPDDPDSIADPGSAPTREECRLLIVAADPIRKRVDLATRTAEMLRDRGINATLSVVGKGTPLSNSSDAVDSIGPLRLSNKDDRQTHQQLLRDCHLQLLPSLGEAFGIAPTESAHFARPSIVADAGGLPYVVLDGQTGIVMDLDADADAWADAIEMLLDDPDRYRTLSSQALSRARNEFHWNAWAIRMKSVIEHAIQAPQT